MYEQFCENCNSNWFIVHVYSLAVLIECVNCGCKKEIERATS